MQFNFDLNTFELASALAVVGVLSVFAAVEGWRARW